MKSSLFDVRFMKDLFLKIKLKGVRSPNILESWEFLHKNWLKANAMPSLSTNCTVTS